jgi:hypothetical protein
MASAALYMAITPPTQDTPKAGVIMSLVKSPLSKLIHGKKCEIMQTDNKRSRGCVEAQKYRAFTG